MARFHFCPSPLAGLLCVERMKMEDARGFLARLFCADEFSAAGAAFSIAQINHTLTRKAGTLRGLHYQQPPYAETKLVSCIRGRIFDVAVDLRAGSPTFLRWHAAELSAKNGRALLIPPGFAHGFQALVDDCDLVYLHSAPYHPEAERVVNLSDPRLAIDWPLPLGASSLADISERDRAAACLSDDFSGIAL